MQQYQPKYSIIIPARNGVNYLPTCVETIISQDFTDYELIISDDHSTDSTPAYLETLHHPNVKKVTPPPGLSMAEHWGWALNQSKGQWLIFVGQDDGLQPYFFKLAEILTRKAEERNLRTIMSERAYFFWPGCDAVYGKVAVSYRAKSELKILNTKFQALRSLLGLQSYFELPEMYTTSLFNRKIIEEAKLKQGGKVFLAHPQDANLAAIACSLESRYLKSMIPLGWVGSSPKSAGLAVMSTAESQTIPGVEDDLKSLRADYLTKTANSLIKYHPLAGDFSLGSTQIYFWGALLQTEMLRSSRINKLIKLSLFKTLMFSSVLSEIQSSDKLNVSLRMNYFFDLLKINRCSYTIVKIYMRTIFPLLKGLDFIYRGGYYFLWKLKSNLGAKTKKTIIHREDWEENSNINMTSTSKKVISLIEDSEFLDLIKS